VVILVDSSVWIDHFRRPDHELELLLETTEIATHPLVIAELACGNLPRRVQTLALLRRLPVVLPVSHAEVIQFVEHEALHGRGLGAVDVHLLASARLAGFSLWTHDKALHAAATRLQVVA
jgi:predicted nucleic acid-binding protein